MYYEPYEKKPPRRRRKRWRRERRYGCLTRLLLRLIALILTLVVGGALLLYAVPGALFLVEPEGVELSLTDGLPSDPVNILLLGLDIRRDNSQRSDAVLIASIGYGRLKLTSVMRDTLVNIPGHGPNKLNAAYAYGGPELVMRTLNETFQLNILHYIAVDFTALARVVDAIGGVELDLSEPEREQINLDVEKAGIAPQDILGYCNTKLLQSGEQVHLNGLQALAYARIRKIDSDFVRASRQRILLNAMLERIRDNLWNPVMLTKLTRTLLDSLDTNMSLVELLALGEKALIASPEQMQIPVALSYDDDGSSLTITDVQRNIDEFRRFVYEE